MPTGEKDWLLGIRIINNIEQHEHLKTARRKRTTNEKQNSQRVRRKIRFL